MQEICRVCGKKVTLENTYVDSYDKTVKEFSCGHKERNAIVVDDFKGDDEVIVGYELLFELEKPVYIGGKTQNDEDIELILDDKKKLTSFKIIVKNSLDVKDINKAIEKATRLANYLTFKRNKVVSHKKPRIEKLPKRGGPVQASFTMKWGYDDDINLDLAEKSLHSLIHNVSDEHNLLSHYKNGLMALKNNDFEKAIKEFYIVIENTPEAEFFTPLRHVLNHNRIDADQVRRKLNDDFDIDIDETKFLNINDPEIQEKLEIISNQIREKSFDYISKQLISGH